MEDRVNWPLSLKFIKFFKSFRDSSKRFDAMLVDSSFYDEVFGKEFLNGHDDMPVIPMHLIKLRHFVEDNELSDSEAINEIISRSLSVKDGRSTVFINFLNAKPRNIFEFLAINISSGKVLNLLFTDGYKFRVMLKFNEQETNLFSYFLDDVVDCSINFDSPVEMACYTGSITKDLLNNGRMKEFFSYSIDNEHCVNPLPEHKLPIAHVLFDMMMQVINYGMISLYSALKLQHTKEES